MAGNSYVPDTHVWISLFHRKRKEYLIDSLIEKDILLISTAEQKKELMHVIHYPEIAELLPGKPKEYVVILESIAEMFPANKRFSLLTDYKDNYPLKQVFSIIRRRSRN